MRGAKEEEWGKEVAEALAKEAAEALAKEALVKEVAKERAVMGEAS